MSDTKTQVDLRANLAWPEEEGLRILGPGGERWTLTQLNDWWGAEVEVIQAVPHPEAGFYARIVELKVSDGPATQLVRVVDEAEEPVAGVTICRWWQDAPALPEFPADCLATRYKDRAVHGETKANGEVGFGMGGGDMPGSSGIWLAHCDCPAGWVGGLGWKPAVAHATLVVTFQVLPAEVPPPEPPTPEPPEGEVVELLQAIWSKLDQIYQNLRTPRVIVEG
jgi:hypothetical protein